LFWKLLNYIYSDTDYKRLTAFLEKHANLPAYPSYFTDTYNYYVTAVSC